MKNRNMTILVNSPNKNSSAASVRWQVQYAYIKYWPSGVKQTKLCSNRCLQGSAKKAALHQMASSQTASGFYTQFGFPNVQRRKVDKIITFNCK